MSCSDPAVGLPLFSVSWDQDKEFRMAPQTVTALLREQVPVLDFVDWKITSIQPGQATSLLPLNAESTNQHFTHQAAMFVLSADYTGGTALASLLHGWPVVGVHPVASEDSISLWLLKADIKYLKPSVGDLTVTGNIAEDRGQKIQRRFLAGKPVIETISMTFHNGSDVVAEASATYFARQSKALRASGTDSRRVNSLYELKLTSSAELIAGVRARESGRLFFDPFAAKMAGQHGMALAERFCQRSPQLGKMVAARTAHLDQVVRNFTAAGGRHIVNVGVGWDMRAFRLNVPAKTTFYEVDFPTTLEARAQRLREHEICSAAEIERLQIPLDLRTMPLDSVLADRLPDDAPVLVMWEGMTMYFKPEEVREILAGIRPVLSHPDSILWLDLVDRAPIAFPERFPISVREFMRGMQILGEPFTFGVDQPQGFLADAGLESLEVVPSGAYFPEMADPIYSIYHFCVARQAIASRWPTPSTFRPAAAKKGSVVPAPHFNNVATDLNGVNSEVAD